MGATVGQCQGCVDLGRKLADALLDLAEHEAVFELQHGRMGAAVELWRQEDPEGRALTIPDLGNLLEWLMARRAGADRVAMMRLLGWMASRGQGSVKGWLLEEAEQAIADGLLDVGPS